jgi:hypothetical protein
MNQVGIITRKDWQIGSETVYAASAEDYFRLRGIDHKQLRMSLLLELDRFLWQASEQRYLYRSWRRPLTSREMILKERAAPLLPTQAGPFSTYIVRASIADASIVAGRTSPADSDSLQATIKREWPELLPNWMSVNSGSHLAGTRLVSHIQTLIEWCKGLEAT